MTHLTRVLFNQEPFNHEFAVACSFLSPNNSDVFFELNMSFVLIGFILYNSIFHMIMLNDIGMKCRDTFLQIYSM